MVPEESYSRHLDKEVASQEYPYGHDYDMQFKEVEQRIEKVAKQDRKQRK